MDRLPPGALLEHLRFVFQVSSAIPPMEGSKYSVNSDRVSSPKVQGQSTVKVRDFVRHKTGQVSKIAEGEATVTLEEDGLVVSAPLNDWAVPSDRK